jgi:outer membrane immunogenic protein
LTLAAFFLEGIPMKQLSRLTIALFACSGLAITAMAGPEPPPSGKEMKEVAPLPPPCNWQGFYFGINAGGQFGHSEDTTLDGYNTYPGKAWGYSESGFTGGGQVGYNWQWRWLVLGPEFDAGYMSLHGHGTQPGSPSNDTHGESDAGFFTTLRGRVGVALDWHGPWLIYATGGAIGVDYTTRVIDDKIIEPGGGALEDGRRTDFNWGYTVGGGIERMIGCHWSVKAEYLYYSLGDQKFTGHGVQEGPFTTDWSGETTGHIIRAGLNYKF